VGQLEGDGEAVSWAVVWLPEGGETITESYVNLIPTPQGGTHVNGFRSGLLAAIREFCEFRKLIPRGIKLAPDDIWDRCAYVLSAKMTDPQFSGQTKERLSSRQCASFVNGVVKDAFSLWLNQHTEAGERLAEMAIESARNRLKAGKKIVRKKSDRRPGPARQAGRLYQPGPHDDRVVPGGGGLGRRIGQTGQGPPVPGGHAAAGQDPQHLGGRNRPRFWLQGNSRHCRGHRRRSGHRHISAGLRYGKICILADADSDGLHIATLLCALFLQHFTPLVKAGHVFVAMPPLYRIDMAKEVHYALDEAEKTAIIRRMEAQKKGSKSTSSGSRGWAK
jgi:topoisomerase-4 subunit B